MTDKGSPSDCSSRACPNVRPFLSWNVRVLHVHGLHHSPRPTDQTHPLTLLLTPATPPFQQTHPSTLLTLASQQTKTACNQPASKRFRLASAEELSQLSKGFTPENTDKSTKWALTNFLDWAKEKNVNPGDILLSSDPKILNEHLSRYIVETRKESGQSYPPSTLHQLLCGLLRYMRQTNPDALNFLDKKDTRFKPLQSHFKNRWLRIRSSMLMLPHTLLQRLV